MTLGLTWLDKWNEEAQTYRDAGIRWVMYYNGNAPTSWKVSPFVHTAECRSGLPDHYRLAISVVIIMIISADCRGEFGAAVIHKEEALLGTFHTLCLHSYSTGLSPSLWAWLGEALPFLWVWDTEVLDMAYDTQDFIRSPTELHFSEHSPAEAIWEFLCSALPSLLRPLHPENWASCLTLALWTTWFPHHLPFSRS